VDEVRLLVVVRCEDDEVDDALEDLETCQHSRSSHKGFTYRPELVGVFLDGLRVQDLSVVLADIQVLVVVLRQRDLLLVEPELQVRHVVLRLDGRVVGTAVLLLLLALLLVLLELLGRLLRPPRKVACADLPAEDAGLCPVSLLYAQRNLLQDELGLFSPGHGTERLDLELAEDVRRRIDVALLLLDVRQYTGDARSLDFDEDLCVSATQLRLTCVGAACLALGDCPQRLDDGQLGV
jgi:hypothetical protein